MLRYSMAQAPAALAERAPSAHDARRVRRDELTAHLEGMGDRLRRLRGAPWASSHHPNAPARVELATTHGLHVSGAWSPRRGRWKSSNGSESGRPA